MKILDRFRRKPPVITTMIDGQDHQVTEWARKQAAMNMKLDPYRRQQIIDMLGEAEARRRYPESFE